MTKEELTQEISKLVVKFSTEELEALLKVLQKQYLMAKAERLQSSVLPNEISMDEIVEEVSKARQARYEQGNI